MSDTPETQKVFDWFYSRNSDRVSSFIGINRVQARMEDMERERDEARRGIRLMAQNAEVWKERADQARRELDIQLESIQFHMEQVPVREHPLRADDAPLSGEEHEKSDTPITDAALIERRHIHKRDGSVQLLELVDAEIAKKLERKRNSLQDQRDFAMGEIERLRKEYFEMLDSAWGLIANAGGGNCNWDLQTERWRQAARRWRDKYLSTPASKEEKEDAK